MEPLALKVPDVRRSALYLRSFAILSNSPELYLKFDPGARGEIFARRAAPGADASGGVRGAVGAPHAPAR